MHDATKQSAVTTPQAAIADEQLDQPTTLEDKLLDERDAQGDTAQPDAATAWAAATTATGRALPDLDSWQHARQSEWDAENARRAEMLTNAKNSDAYAQLARCFPKWTRLSESLRYSAVKRLAENRPVNPNVPETWNSSEMAARALLRRYGITKVNVNRLMLQAIDRMVDAQERIDADAGIDWAEVVAPATQLDEKLRVAHKALPLDLDDPNVWAYREEQRQAAGRKLGIDEQAADELSRWALGNLDQFDADEVRCWRIGSPTWLGMAERDLGPVAETVERPIGVFITPDTKSANGWRLSPVLSLELIRLVNELGGIVDRSLTFAEVPVTAIDEFLERVNPQTLHDGPLENMESASKMQEALKKALNGREIGLSPIDKKIDRWGRLKVNIGRYGYSRSELKASRELQASEHSLRIGIKTGRVKEFPQRRVGATSSDG